MIRRLIDLLLIVAIAVGGVLAWQSGRERARLQSEADRLSRKAGDLAIGDPNRAHVTALETGQPLHFAWRIYMPAGATQDVRYDSGGLGSSSSEARESIARVRFREDEEGDMEIYTHFGGGSSRSSINDPELAGRLRGHREGVEVEQLGRGDVVAIDPGRPTTLLRLTLPDDLRGEAPDDPEPALFEVVLRYSLPPGAGPAAPGTLTTQSLPPRGRGPVTAPRP